MSLSNVVNFMPSCTDIASPEKKCTGPSCYTVLPFRDDLYNIKTSEKKIRVIKYEIKVYVSATTS